MENVFIPLKWLLSYEWIETVSISLQLIGRIVNRKQFFENRFTSI